MSFTCPVCRRTSYSEEDERHGYCGACHAGFYERGMHGQFRRSSRSPEVGQSRPVQLPEDDEEPKAE